MTEPAPELVGPASLPLPNVHALDEIVTSKPVLPAPADAPPLPPQASSAAVAATSSAGASDAAGDPPGLALDPGNGQAANADHPGPGSNARL